MQTTPATATATERREGWESRLSTVIERARHERYALGEHDCFRVACAAVEALTGMDRWQEWAGKYHTKQEAIPLIVNYADGHTVPGHSSSFTVAFSKFFGCEPVSVKMARRGDIVEYHDRHESHLGVAMTLDAAVLLETGLTFVPLAECRHAWRIG